MSEYQSLGELVRRLLEMARRDEWEGLDAAGEQLAQHLACLPEISRIHGSARAPVTHSAIRAVLADLAELRALSEARREHLTQEFSALRRNEDLRGAYGSV